MIHKLWDRRFGCVFKWVRYKLDRGKKWTPPKEMEGPNWSPKTHTTFISMLLIFEALLLVVSHVMTPFLRFNLGI